MKGGTTFGIAPTESTPPCNVPRIRPRERCADRRRSRDDSADPPREARRSTASRVSPESDRLWRELCRPRPRGARLRVHGIRFPGMRCTCARSRPDPSLRSRPTAPLIDPRTAKSLRLFSAGRGPLPPPIKQTDAVFAALMLFTIDHRSEEPLTYMGSRSSQAKAPAVHKFWGSCVSRR